MIVRWAIQSSTASAGPAVVADACRKRGSSFDLHAWQDHELPDVREAETLVYYGSCKFIANILTTRRMPEGVFGCAGDFDYRRYIEHYGDFMLNRDARILSIRELLDSGPPSGRFFLRDVGDSKTLAGQVWTSRQWEMFAARRCEQEPIDLELEVLLAPRKMIEKEWRVFMVDQRVSSASQYRYFGDLLCLRGLPDAVERFALTLAARWSPCRAFVMDIGLVDDGLKVVELNGFNSSGFYSADVEAVVADVEAVLRSGA